MIDAQNLSLLLDTVALHDQVDLMLVTKYLDHDSLLALDQLCPSHVVFGESRLSQLSQRMRALPNRLFYCIGPLQSRQIKAHHNLIEQSQLTMASVWKERHLQCLSEMSVGPLLLQVNGPNLSHQGGIECGEVASVLQVWRDTLNVSGVMSMGVQDDIEASLAVYESILIQSQREQWFPKGGVFSLGMSLDWFETIEHCVPMMLPNDRLLLRVGKFYLKE